MVRNIIYTNISRQAQNLAVNIGKIFTGFNKVISFLVEVRDFGVKSKFVSQVTSNHEIEIVAKEGVVINNTCTGYIVIGKICLNFITTTTYRNSIGECGTRAEKVIIIV